jgi:hypothetical protein
VKRVSDALRLAELRKATARISAAADWIGQNYHPDWHLVKALDGVGVHHARVPRAIGQYVVRCFNDGDLDFLVCTSTLIEGVNTRAKNMIVLDHTIRRRAIDLFTYNNIRGRAGRMLHHFVGKVFLFHDEPEGELPFVDLPIFSQDDSTPESVLLQVDEEDLTALSKERLRVLEQEEVLEMETLRANVGIDPQQQLAVAREIEARAAYYQPLLAWHGIPKGPQLNAVCNLMWDYFGGTTLASGSVRTLNQLVAMIWQLSSRHSFSTMIRNTARRLRIDHDEATTRFNDFIRLWAQFHFPRLLTAIDRIQRDIF